MSAERLEVKMVEGAAEIDGRFHFRSLAVKGHMGESSDVGFAVPIWVPSEAKYADARTAALLRTCSVSELNWLKGEKQAAWDDAVGLKINVGKHALKIDAYAVWDPRGDKNKPYVENAWLRKGYYCLLVRVHFRPEWLAGNPEIRVRYRQGLRLTRAGGEFHYVPTFEPMPPTQTTQDLDRYAMHVLNTTAWPISLGTVSLPSGSRAVLPLAHHVPVELVVRKK